MATSVAIPDSIDLRKKWWKIGNQGFTGSCVGWATADGVLRWHFVKKNLLEKDNRLSPRFVWMASKETDVFQSRPTSFIEQEGTSIKAALDITRKFGAVPDSVLGIGDGELYKGLTDTFYAIASKYKILSYFNLGRDLHQWRQWIALNGPIVTRLVVDNEFMYPNSNGKLDTFRPETAKYGHAVALVGYDSKGFIIRNSWGTRWGDKGFAHATDHYIQQAFGHAYGINI